MEGSTVKLVSRHVFQDGLDAALSGLRKNRT